MGDHLIEKARRAFVSQFQAEPDVVARAPGRVELLGNHTDYNGGLVLAAAIDRETVVAGRAAAAPGHSGRIHSVSFEETLELDYPESFTSPDRKAWPGSWQRYVEGVAASYGAFPAISYQAVIDGNVPLGAGLSSSASLEAAFALFLNATEPERAPHRDGTDATRMALAEHLRDVENHY